MFKNRSVTTIYIWGMLVTFLFALMFIVLLIHEEHNDFDRESSVIRKKYIETQKNHIKFNVEQLSAFLEQINLNYSKVPVNNLLESVEKIYIRNNKIENVFIFDKNGNVLLYTTDKNYKKISFKVPKKSGFVPYTYNGKAKIAYIKHFAPLGLSIGSEVYMDEAGEEINRQKLELKKRLIKIMMEILSLSVILFGFAIIWVGIVHNIIIKQIATFSAFFQRASQEYSSIDVEDIDIREFRAMIPYVNSMVNEIHTKKNKLKDMNMLLEKKVKRKTQDLERQNKLLAEEKNFSESLVAAQDNFIRSSIHEINTPLAVILTHIDIYKLKFGQNDYLSKIESATKMIANIYDDLSYMVKKNRVEHEEEIINISDFLFNRIDFFTQIANSNKQKIVSNIQNDIFISFAPIELQRIVDNNLSNAIKYAKKSTNIVVNLRKIEKDIILEFITESKVIQDTKKIFDPFHRENSYMPGFGLGLEIVKSICDKREIKIDVKSDKNSTIFVYTFGSLK
ncbi:putative two-component sensor histidine kinase [Sulfurovum sp. enrichment culture clone C5]|uniref:histidine kinase n=1 Tax=Sulfurovum sp. enrichment culture clone C5 TaxID=497650 RepID=A0A0S4XN15_9BACT|nr:putative two-component sensor histidine kinase [Sulfurovum sp. enrichment culture clone C5]